MKALANSPSNGDRGEKKIKRKKERTKERKREKRQIQDSRQ